MPLPVPGNRWQVLRFAWVGASILGAEYAGAVALIICLTRFRNSLRQIPKIDRNATVFDPEAD